MPTDPRPDPDDLLARLQAQAGPARGRLRLYFGASAGVGKTFAMLLAARQQQALGTDVLAGVVETHGRNDTAALLDGLPRLPPARLAHRGRDVPEFDLDGALARRPALLLVDELAHSNAPGSRHAKRWQDVEELLAAGIDVHSTLNVQHLESLNDVVGGITGIVVGETVPDSVFDGADEVVLIDTPADELIARLRAGRVYAPDQAEHAAQHFFRKGNLMALRELALRRTADRVETDVQAYRSDRAIQPVWKTEAALLCGVGAGDGAEHVVRSAARLAQRLAVPWHAVHVETPALQRRPPARRERVLHTLRLAQSLGADTSVVAGRHVAAELIAHARRHNLSKLLLGRPAGRTHWPRRPLRATVAADAADIDVIEVGRDAPVRPHPSTASASGEALAPGPYLAALATCIATTLLALPLKPYFDLANIVMLFLLAVVGVALRWGRGPAVLSAFANVAAFDFVFVSPRWSFAVSDAQYLLTFAVMLAVGLVTGQLTAGLRFQATDARRREARSRVLFEVARDLSNVLMAEQAVALAAQAIGREFDAQVRCFLLDRDDRLVAPPSAPADGLEPGTAQWVLDHGEPAGRGTDTLAGSAWLYLPLTAPMRTRGVLAVCTKSPTLLGDPGQRRQLDTFVALTAMALERVHYVEVAREATVQIESERLRNSLLSALSHDLRTPLAVLAGLAETLGARAGDAEQRQLADALRDESRRMNQLVENLLDMARLQSGPVHLRLEWQSLEEMIGSALRAARPVLGERPVAVRLAPGFPLVRCDAVLMERVFVNLLENAAKYTPPGTPLHVTAETSGDEVQVTVADTGPGVPPALEAVLFEKFTRGAAESATPGVGLGLAICQAIAAAHGGQMRYRANLPHGACFVIVLPRGTPPAWPDETPE